MHNSKVPALQLLPGRRAARRAAAQGRRDQPTPAPGAAPVLRPPQRRSRKAAGEPDGSPARRRTTTRIEDTLTTHGYDVDSEIVYVRLADEIASYRTSTTSLAVVGLIVVAISTAGLANAPTMSVLERTREIGILRSIGARARDIRRIFAAETLTLAAAGWLIGIPLGYLLDLFLVWLVRAGVPVRQACRDLEERLGDQTP